MTKSGIKLFIIFCFVLLLENHYAAQDSIRKNVDFSDLFGKYPDCAMTIYDLKNDHYYRFNARLCRRQLITASTFKIPNTLIALETGTAKDENYAIKWDSTRRDIPAWNRDHTLKTAFQNSVVWYYKELARRVGMDKMQEYVNRLNYGNGKITGGRNAFWLDGDLKISADEQVDFLIRIYNQTLPVSKRSLDILKEIMITEKTDEYTLRGKTGWAVINGLNIGWYVGYLEQNDNTWFFAVNINSKNPETFSSDRIGIAREALKRLGLL